MLNWISLH